MGTFRFVEDVNKQLPEIQRLLARIGELNDKSISLSKDIQDLFNIWGNQIRQEKNADHEFYKERAHRKKAINREIEEVLGRIQDAGGIVKDIKKGLVDFYCDHPAIMEKVRQLTEGEDEGIYLCWRQGEARVEHWHLIRGGFAKRRPLRELFEATFV